MIYSLSYSSYFIVFLVGLVICVVVLVSHLDPFLYFLVFGI